jgi:hypothetical protein
MMQEIVKPTATMNNSERLSTMVFDYSTNYSLSMSNISSLSDLDHSLAQIKVVLDIFQEANLVLGEPANTVIIAMYCILVTIAGKDAL